MEEARKLEHLKEVTERQLLAEQQILKLEAELKEEQKKKEELVILFLCQYLKHIVSSGIITSQPRHSEVP